MASVRDDFIMAGMTFQDGTISGVVFDVITGAPDYGPFSRAVGLDSTDKVKNNLWRIDQFLVNLIPSMPPDLSTITLIPTNSVFTANKSITPYDSVSNLIANDSPVNTLESNPFWDPKEGTLTLYTKSSSGPEYPIGTRILTPGSDVGIYNKLEITADEDPYTGSDSGFYLALKARVINGLTFSASNTIEYYYKLTHSLTGTTILPFYCDVPIIPNLPSTVSITSYPDASNIIYQSGIGYYKSGAPFEVTFTVTNVISKFYNPTGTGRVSGDQFSTVYGIPTGAQRDEGASNTFTLITTVLPNAYSDNAIINVNGINFRNDLSPTAYPVPLGQIMIDSTAPSSEASIRLSSGSGMYPVAGYGLAYDSTESLLANEELLYANNLFTYPSSTDYSSKQPAGPNYSAIGTITRWVTFSKTYTDYISNFTVTFNDAENMNSVIIPNFYLHALMSGSTEWIDGNIAYIGVGSPSLNGDSALVYHMSSNTTKKITFGSTPRTGTLYIRIGLSNVSTIRFSSIDIV